MKTINYIKSLNTDEQQLLGGCVIFVLGALFLMYLVSTANPPIKYTEAKDMQTYVKPNYELPKSFDKYCEHVYNSKFK